MTAPTATQTRTLRERFNRAAGYIAVAALAIAAYSAFGVRGVQDDQRDAQVEADVDACQFGNGQRQALRELQPAVQREVIGDLADYFAVDPTERQDIVTRAEDAATRIAEEKIIDRDCTAIPGATPATEDP